LNQHKLSNKLPKSKSLKRDKSNKSNGNRSNNSFANTQEKNIKNVQLNARISPFNSEDENSNQENY
jgi:hypothetical protein